MINGRHRQNVLDRDKLAKVLGMLGSAHDGEIAAAGRKANQILIGAGTTWHDVLRNGDVRQSEMDLSNSAKNELRRLRAKIARLEHEIELLHALQNTPPEWHQPADEDEQIKLCIEWRAYLDEFERQFVMSLLAERRLDRHEAAVLWEIVLKTRTSARRMGRTE